MSVILERIGYLLEGMSQAGLSARTGFPQSTLSYVVNELRELPAKYENVLYNTYRSEAYQNLRDYGASIVEANRFKGGSVSRLRTVEGLYNQMTEWTTRSALESEITRRGGYMSIEEQADYLAYIEERVKRGYQHSNETTETIEDYISREGFEFEGEEW